MASLYADDGSLRVTFVDGTSYTGRTSSDESMFVTPSSTAPDDVEGLEHPCGAMIVTVAPDNANIPRYAANGSMYIQISPYTSTGAQRVTVVAPSGGGGPPPNQLIVPPLFTNTNSFPPTILTAGHKIINAPLLTNTNSFFTPVLLGGTEATHPSLVTNTNSFATPVVTQGSNGYTAKAVHFDGLTRIFRTSLNATNGFNFAYSIWFKILSTSVGNFALWSSDPTTNGSCWAQFVTSSHHLESYWKDETTAKKQPAMSATTTQNLYDSTWHHILFAGRSNEAVVNQNQRVTYLDDVKLTTTNTSAGHGPFHLILNTEPFFFGDDNENNFLIGDIADFWFTTSLDLIDGSGNISLANRRKFIDSTGKPVDPINFPAADILFSGDHTTFFNNQGTGGAFTAISGALTDASTHP